MWFLGFSTKHGRNFLILGAIVAVILVTVSLRKLLLWLDGDEGGGNNKMNKSRSRSHDQCVCSRAVVRTYGVEEMKMATRNFRIRIGVGATSFVYLAELGDGRYGAVKRVMEGRGGSKKMFLDEVSVLLRISHPNLVGLLGFCLEAGEQLLLLEYVPNKSLFDRMHSRHGQIAGTLPWSSRLSIALDIARALNYLHTEADPPVIHRDVKSSNILLIDNNHAKLADFGLCKLGGFDDGSQTSCIVKGSLGYVDVNYVKTGLVSKKSDVYSFGVLLLELVTGLRSMQDSVTLPEWTEEHRKSEDPNEWVVMLDPKLKGNANMMQVKAIINLANSTLVENYQARPDMNWIVDRISSCIEAQPSLDLPI